MMLRSRLGALLAVYVAVAPARTWAQDGDEPLSGHYSRGKRVLARGDLASMRGRTVRVGGRKEMTIGELADRAFVDHAAITAELRAGRAGLLADPEVTADVVETDEVTVITQSTAAVVVDPDAVRTRSPSFARFHGKGSRDGFTLTRLDKDARARFQAFRDRARRLPANRPLRQAADRGDDALLDAVLDGKGEVRITTTVVVPKREMTRSPSGQLLVPQQGSDGSFDYARTRAVTTPVADDGKAAGAGAGEAEEPRPTTVNEHGQCQHTEKFVTGFTIDDNFVWSRRWDLPSGHFQISASAWYAFGLRVPVAVTATMAPSAATVRGASDQPTQFAVELSADAIDAAAPFYQAAGMGAAHLHDAKELVLGAGFAVTLKLDVGWGAVKIHETLPRNADFDYAQDFRPPMGACGGGCGFDVWIPADVTHTSIGLLGVVKGSAQVGFKVSGKGSASVDFEALYAGGAVDSWAAGDQQHRSRRAKTVSFDARGQTRKLLGETGVADRPEVTRPFGYRLSAPRFDWDVTLIPGVRADIKVKAKPFIDDSFPIGPLWLDSLAFDAGTLHLGRHQGTRDAYKVVHGDKTWHQR